MTFGVARRWRDVGLATRIVGTSLLLLLVVQLAGYGVVRSFIADNARQQIGHELAVGERVWLRVLKQNADKLTLGASVLSADFAFRDAVNTGDMDTIRSALENQGGRIGARLTAYFSPDLRLLASSDESAAAPDPVVLQNVTNELARTLGGRQIAMVGGTPFQFVLVPMRAPVIIGWVLMAFPIDQTLANDVYELLNVHIALVTHDEGGGGELLAVSTLSAEQRQGIRWSSDRPAALQVSGSDMVARWVPLDGARQHIHTVLLRSVDEVLVPFQRLQAVLLLITLVGLALFALGSVFNARRVTRPLQWLVESANRLKAGDFASAVPGTGQVDEVGALARAFDQMRQSIADKQAEVQRLAYWDRLTGLPNREQFRATLVDAMVTHPAESVPVSVVTLNLDRFKHVNDVLGYAFGDELLCAVAQRLQGLLRRKQDMVARLGGDVFGLLLYRTEHEGAHTLTQAIARLFEEPLTLRGQTVDVNASMGVATWPTHADQPDLLLSRSEIAMHAAKSRTAGVLVYEPRLDSSSAENLSLLTDLRRAVEQGELRLYLQPKVSVATGRVVAAEALVRWQHPERGLVPPMQFIPFAEQTGFIRQLTLWMFEEAARQWTAIQTPEHAIRIAVNLSTRDLLDLAFPSRLAELLARYGVSSKGFCLEITESAIMDDPLRAESTLNKLASQGFKLSIDDFGTGYSSLAYLKRLPVSELKIDKSFVMGMTSDNSDAKIVRSTIDLAHNLGLTVVAEGVEDAAILSALGTLGCDEAQGYHMSKPVPSVEFAAACARWHQKLPA